MDNMIRFLSIATLAILLTAGAANAQSHDHHANNRQVTITPTEMVDGVMVVEIEVGKMGFSTDKVTLKAGVPARLVFTRTEEGGCTHQVQIPDFGVEATDLPLSEPVAIEFTPQEGGTFAFACGMGMVEGTLLVKS